MKKIIVIFMMCTLPIASYSANMCVKDDAYVIVLDPQIAGTVISNDTTNKTWSTQFPYGVISGIGTCSNVVNSTAGTPATDQTAISVTNTTGAYCYCKMLRPFESQWIFIFKYVHSGACSASCNCANRDVGIRRAFFSNPVI